MAGGFSSGGAGASAGAGARVKMEGGDIEMEDLEEKKGEGGASLLRVQTLGGKIKVPEDGDPVYMLGAFRGSECSSLFLALFSDRSLTLGGCM